MRLTPTQRAAVVIEQARRLGEGRPVSRADVVRVLFGQPDVALDRTESGPVVTLAPPLALVPLFVQPPVTDGHQDHGGEDEPDTVASFADAARRLGLAVATARRYAAPSAGKLVRLGTGVSLASVERLAASR